MTRRLPTKLQIGKPAEAKKRAATYVDLGRCEVCNTPRLASCPNCVDADQLPEQGRMTERGEILVIVREQLKATPPFDGAVPALRRLIKAIEDRSLSSKSRERSV